MKFKRHKIYLIMKQIKQFKKSKICSLFFILIKGICKPLQFFKNFCGLLSIPAFNLL